MRSDQLRRELESKRRKRSDCERKAAKARQTEAAKAAAASKAVESAQRSSSEPTMRSKLRQAERKSKESLKAGKEAAKWQAEAARLSQDEAKLVSKLAKAEKSEREKAERDRLREQQRAEQRRSAQMASVDERMGATEADVAQIMRELRAAKIEPLRILLLGAASDGDLRVGREQKRIQDAVQRSVHRDYVSIDVRPAATADDLLDGLSRTRPHVVHFSGHSSEDLLSFEEDVDLNPSSHLVSASAFARAVEAVDEPPMLVVLNSCRSAAQLEELVASTIPLAIGMRDSITDGDAIRYAARLYAAVADGQSVLSAHRLAQADLQLGGSPDAHLPQLAHADDVDPLEAVLVRSPSGEQ